MTMIALMSAILVFSPQNSFQIAFKNLKASWHIPAICFQNFESKSLEKFCQRLDFKFLKANRWRNFESKIQKN